MLNFAPDLHTLALFGPIGTWEMIVILGLGLLVFGRRLPEVGRSLGKGIVEFKRGLKDIGDEIEEESSKPSAPHRTAISSASTTGGGALPENGPTFKAPVNAEGEDARVRRGESVEE